jgi:DNA-binding NarL/FixJ family response regulator
VKILIADDHQLVREGLKLLISQFYPELTFAEAYDYASLREQMRLHNDLQAAVIDLHMPGADQDYGLSSIANAHPSIPLVAVSAYSSSDVVRNALALPTVYAFVPKNGSTLCMQVALQAALKRDKIGEVTDASAKHKTQSPDLLAPRLALVRSLLRQGMSNKAIAHELGLSEGTVKNYMSEIFKSLKVTNRTQAARID